MALDSGATILPGRGTVFIGDVDATPPDYQNVDPMDPTTYEGWDCIGHTSRENTVALNKDGGDAEQKGSWWDPAIRESREPTQWTWTVNSLQIDAATLSLAWPAGMVENGAYWVPGADTSVEKAAFILCVDQSARLGIYLPRTPLQIGEAPEITVDDFFEIQLQGSILSSQETGNRIGWFHPSFQSGGSTAPSWSSETSYAVDDSVSLSGGQELLATVSGTSGTTEPTAPSSVGGTVEDGTVTWERTA